MMLLTWSRPGTVTDLDTAAICGGLLLLNGNTSGWLCREHFSDHDLIFGSATTHCHLEVASLIPACGLLAECFHVCHHCVRACLRPYLFVKHRRVVFSLTLNDVLKGPMFVAA